MTHKSHNPTPEERDERFSLYGLDPEKVIEAVLEAKPETAMPKVKKTRKKTRSSR